MAKLQNSSNSVSIRITVSHQSAELLDQLAERGIYGRNRSEVAARFVDEALRGYVEPPKLKIKVRRKGGRDA